MSILLQESGGGGGNASTAVSSAGVTPIGDGNDGASSSLAVDNDPASKDACTGDCHYGRSFKQYVELLIQKTVIDVDEQEQQQDDASAEEGCVCEAQSNSSECHNPKHVNQQQQEQQQQQEEHSEHLFPLSCCCRMCIVSREVVMKLYAEDCQYNSLWDRLQLLMKQYYDLIPESEDNALYNQYMELMSKSSLKWLTDAHYPEQNMIQMSLASNLPLSNEMAFVMLTKVLSTRDPHQLFELLCFQLRSIVQVYCVGFEDLFTENPDDGSRQFNAPEVLNYIVNGYKKLRQSARTVAPLLNVLEQCHLGKFGLTWWLINQRIFQRYFYYEVQSILPECMLRLRGSLPEREYQELVGRFLKFDKEMTDISLSWTDVWPLLYDYHRSAEDCERRNRISTVHTLLQAIRGSRYAPKSPELFEQPERPIAEWLTLENRKLVWEYVVHCLKTKWIPGVSSRLSNVCDYVKCPGCDRPLNTHNIVCVCLTCIIGGGIFNFRPKKEINERYRMCTCANMIEMLLESQGKKAPDTGEDDPTTTSSLSSLLLNSGEAGLQNGCSYASSPEHASLSKDESGKVDNAAAQDSAAACLPLVESLGEDEELYHIAWAIFKHLPERVQYRWSTLEPSRFCTFQAAPCASIACRVAVNIIAMNYPVHLSRLLIQTYKPVSEEPRRIMKGNWNTKARNSLRKFCDNVNKRWHEEIDDQMHPLLFVDMFWSLQNSALNLPKTRASDLAEWFILDTQAPPRNVFYQYFTKFFLVKENDIVFDLECFERARERSISPSRMRDSLMQKLESNAALLAAPCPTTLSSSVSSTSSSSSSSSSCLSSSNSSSSSCSISTTSAATVAAAAAAAAAAASSFIEPMGSDTCITNGVADEGRGCTCTCNNCVTEFLSKSEMLSKQLDTSARDSWTQRTNMLEMELKALLKERNMLLEQGRGKRHPCKLMNCDDSCTAASSEPSKVDLNVESDGTKEVASTQNLQSTVPGAADVSAENAQQQTEKSIEEIVISTEKCTISRDGKGAAEPAKTMGAPAQPNSSSKASLNDNSAKSSPSTSAVCTQAVGKTPDIIPTTMPKVSNEELLTPAKLSAFAKMAASKIPAPSPGNALTKSPLKKETAPCANGGGSATKAKPLATAQQQQPGTGGRTIANTAPPASVAATQTHNSGSKPCPCGLPSHAAGAKAATSVSKAKSTAAPGSANSGTTTHSKEEHKKSCHRGIAAAPTAAGSEKAEGSCVCYYCTLFGQSECNHNQRTNETREKLRKKLQKQQMMNDKMFNEERQKQQQLKQKAASSDGSTVAKETKPIHTKPFAASSGSSSALPSGVQSKVSSTLNAVPPANCNSKVGAAASTAAAAAAAAVDKGNKKTAKSVPNAAASSKDRFQSIDDLLRFIEGDDTPKGSEKGSAKVCSSHNSSAPSANGNAKTAPEKANNKKTPKSGTSSASAPSKDRFQSIDDLLRYIEGEDTAKAPSNGAKSAAKSNRILPVDKSAQKPLPTTKSASAVTAPVGKDSDTMKKAKVYDSLKMIGELEVLRQKFYDCQKQEQKTQLLLQDPSGLTKKERKELPLKMQTYRQQKNELHAAINVLVSSIRNEIPEYPFKLEAFATPPPCCPPPSQQILPPKKASQSGDDVLQQVGRRGVAPGTMLPPPPSTLTGPGKTCSSVRSTAIAKLQESISLFQQKRQQNPDEMHTQHEQMLQQHLQHLKQQQQQQQQHPQYQQQQQKLQQQQHGASNDSASRQMVTIKRTFLPHTEPQVTVTAKGDSPDQDQILYTFINGQIVPINEQAGAGDGSQQYQKPKKVVPQPGDAPIPGMASSKVEKAKVGGQSAVQKAEDPFADFSAQEKRLILEYVDQLYQQPLGPVEIEDGEAMKRSSRSKKRTGKADGHEEPPPFSMNDLLQERMLRQSVELIKNLQSDRKTNPEMLSLANKVKKDLLEMQKNPKTANEKFAALGASGGAAKGNANALLNNQTAKKAEQPIAKPTPAGDDQGKGGKGKATTAAAVTSETGQKGKNKKDGKKDKLIEEIDEIVARLNLLDSDEEESKPTAKRKQKSSASNAKVLNRKQSKDSVVSSGSGSTASGVKQQPTKSQSKQQSTQQQTRKEQEKHSESQEPQTKKKGTTATTQKPSRDDNSAAGKEKSKGQVQQMASTVDTQQTVEVVAAVRPVVKKKAPKTFIDPEFDNNAFRLLNMDDSESDVEEEEEIEIEESKPTAPVKVESVALSQSKSSEQVKETKQKAKDTIPAVEQNKTKAANTANAQKNAPEKDKKSTQKKAGAKHDRDSNNSAASAAGSGKQHQKRDEVESASSSGGNDAEPRPKKQTAAQAMVEKISALLDSPGLSNRQRKQMIRQLEQAQATIQSQLLQNAAKATKAKVQAQAQQEKIANQKATNASSASSHVATTKSGAGKESNGKARSSANDESGSSSGSGPSNSLMDQLRRGIRAEGLDLPPGITLTRLDAIQSEALRLKRESIRKITEPMKPVAPPLDPSPAMLAAGSFGIGAGSPNPGMFVVNPMAPLSAPSAGQESVIMVNTGKLRGKEQQHQQQSPVPDAGLNGDRKKRSKRRNKNKNKDQEHDDQLPSSNGASVAAVTDVHLGGKAGDGSNIVTLRNPMFHGGPMGVGGAGMRPTGGATMPADVQGARMTLGYDQPATIFKNDNGMFTIRNPALHHALSGGAPPEATGFRPFNAAYLVENGIMPPAHGSPMQHPMGTGPHVAAAVSSGSGTIIPGSSGVPPYLQQYPSAALDESMGPSKCKSVIGSEMKNAQKQKQNSLQHGWQHMNGTAAAGQDMFAPSSSSSGPIGSGRGDSHYSSFSQYNLAGSDMLGHSVSTGPGNAYGSGMLGSSGYYPGGGNSASVLSKGAAGAIGSERSHALSYLGGADVSTSLASHCCDDETPTAFFNGNSLGSLPSGGMSTRTRYDDLAFLQNLQPGQRLNSEVTIHSINESKLRRQQAQNFTHDIQITAIPAPSPPAVGVGRGLLGTQAVPPSSVSLQHMMHQTQHLPPQRQQQMPQDTHFSDLSPGSGSVGSGSGSGTRAGVALTDFMDGRVAVGSGPSASADLLASSMDAKSFLREYQLGQLQQQMQDLQIQSHQQQQMKGDFGDSLFAAKQPIVGVGEQEANERDLDSIEHFNYYFNAPSGNTTNESTGVINPPARTVPASGGTPDGVEERNPGGVSIGGDELQRPQQPPIGTPSSKSGQQHRLQHNGTPISSAGSILYPATADSPASSVSVFDGISSSLSSQTHSFDDLYTGLLATASPPSSISGGLEGNLHLNIQQLKQQVSAETVPFSGSGCIASNEMPEVTSHARNAADHSESSTATSNK